MARKRKAPEPDNELRWLATYGDVVTLMLAFFVMLYAISQVDQQKFILFVSGLADVFENDSASQGLLEGGEAIVGASSNEPEEGDAGIEGVQVLDGLPQRSIDLPPDDETTDPSEALPADALLTLDDLKEVRTAITAAFETAGIHTRPTLALDTRGLVVSIATDGVLFRSGGFELSEDGKNIIRVIGPILEEFDNPIMVEGHTDSVPLNNGGYTNWNLSADRALAVLDLLLHEFKIDPRRLSATGFGEYQPRAPNDTDEGRALNRRVELVIVAGTVDPLEGENDGG